MRIANAWLDGWRPCAILDDRVVPLPALEGRLPHIAELAAAWPHEALLRWAADGPREGGVPLATVRLGPPVLNPGAILTVAENYARAGSPPGARRPRPLVFGKLPSAIVGPGDVIPWDPETHPDLDAEVELAVVIGRTARQVPEERALEHVFGYTCLNDLASRDPVFEGEAWLLGKSAPGFCPIGPWVVTADELSDRWPLGLTCSLSGVEVQRGSTAQMRFSVSELVAYLSRQITLQPTDLIATGTPTPTAAGRTPPRFLRDGEEVTIRIEGIGELRNSVRTTRVPSGGSGDSR